MSRTSGGPQGARWRLSSPDVRRTTPGGPYAQSGAAAMRSLTRPVFATVPDAILGRAREGSVETVIESGLTRSDSIQVGAGCWSSRRGHCHQMARTSAARCGTRTGCTQDPPLLPRPDSAQSPALEHGRPDRSELRLGQRLSNAEPRTAPEPQVRLAIGRHARERSATTRPGRETRSDHGAAGSGHASAAPAGRT